MLSNLIFSISTAIVSSDTICLSLSGIHPSFNDFGFVVLQLARNGKT